MSIRETIQIGDPRLKATNQVVVDSNQQIRGLAIDDKVKQVVQDLIDTMRANDLVGMAAPQIGENFRVFVTEPRETEARTGDQTDELRVYINPKIVEMSSEEVIIYEGCGSVRTSKFGAGPETDRPFGPVLRPKIITVEASDPEGRTFRLKCDGILARVIQHEQDHLEGVEFTEKVSDYNKLMSREFYLKDIRNSKEQTEACVISVKEVS